MRDDSVSGCDHRYDVPTLADFCQRGQSQISSLGRNAGTVPILL